MELHLVGGFLGSGKTTAIIQAARQLADNGQRVGIITNEQGKHLVDTGYIHSQGLTALEVTGGCICCHLDDFQERIEEIINQFKPDVIFAESVGSCTDLVATVLKPLADYRKSSARPASLSVFADSRLLLRYLRGQEMPFSEGVVYIFEKQIEETGLLIINKIDLLPTGDTGDVLRLAKLRYPGKHLRPQNSLEEEDVKEWLNLIRSQALAIPRDSLDLNYDTYAAAEGRFAWVDRTLELEENITGEMLENFIEKIAEEVSASQYHLAHLKFHVSAGGYSVKINLTGMDADLPGYQMEEIKKIAVRRATMMINIMAECELDGLARSVDNIISKFGQDNDITIREMARFNRAPGYPQPTMRIGN